MIFLEICDIYDLLIVFPKIMKLGSMNSYLEVV